MKTIIFTTVCLISFLNCTKATKNNHLRENIAHATIYYNVDTLNRHKQDFSSFIMLFDSYEKRMIDKHFFNTRREREDEMNIEIAKSQYSSFIPYDSTCNCEREEFYYHPCYKIEDNDFYTVAINGYCDIPTTKAFPYCAELLVTYDKCGNIIDFIIVGYYSDIEYCTIKTNKKENELKVTQYTFDDSTVYHNTYSGVCNISEYTITVNKDGSIDKNIIREYEDNVTLQLD